MEITKKEMKAIFTEWCRRQRENPEEFDNYEDDTPEEYGKSATDYFVEVLKDMRK